nr:hypothetical protein Itr_chr11CG15130 [Ipomoea trifida]GMC52814.1 hypothetical protein Iba_chr01dCG0850 [Ipomoea batatas]
MHEAARSDDGAPAVLTTPSSRQQGQIPATPGRAPRCAFSDDQRQPRGQRRRVSLLREAPPAEWRSNER